MPGRKFGFVYQFKIVLLDTEPPVWRRIQLRADCSFWELHVALQDAMGWLDYHLHLFKVVHPVKGVGEIGIPSEDDADFGWTILPGWRQKVSDWMSTESGGNTADYQYDYGDNWCHKVVLEKILPREKGVKYPRCVDGKRACPPVDCGGVWGYEEICQGKSEFQDEFKDYDPGEFHPEKVKFDDPKKRFRIMTSPDDGD